MKKKINLNGLVFEVKPLSEQSSRRKYHGQLCSYEQLTDQAIQHQLSMMQTTNRIVRNGCKR